MKTGFITSTGRYTPRYSVQVFAEAMEEILQSNDSKGGWDPSQCPMEFLEGKLDEEVGEWKQFQSPYELLDIANFCMMLYHRSLDNKDCYR